VKIAVLQGKSENNVLTGFSESLSSSFDGLGYQTTLVDLRTEPKTGADAILRGSYDVTVSFNAMLSGYQVTQDSKPVPLSKAFGGVFVSWFVDDTLYHANRILALQHNSVILTPSSSHELFIRKLGCKSPVHQLLAGTTVTSDAEVLAFREREFDVIIAGSWMGDPEPFWENIEDPILARIFEGLAQTLRIKSAPRIFESVLRELGNNGISEIDLNEMYPYLLQLHLFTRKASRLEIVERISRFGKLRIAVVGNGWESSLRAHANIVDLPPTRYIDLKRLYRKARFVVCPNTENGACERVFDALEVGSIPDRKSVV
jgi:hypothetical protein